MYDDERYGLVEVPTTASNSSSSAEESSSLRRRRCRVQQFRPWDVVCLVFAARSPSSLLPPGRRRRSEPSGCGSSCTPANDVGGGCAGDGDESAGGADGVDRHRDSDGASSSSSSSSTEAVATPSCVVLQAVPTSARRPVRRRRRKDEDDDEENTTVFVHPILYDFLSSSSAAAAANERRFADSATAAKAASGESDDNSSGDDKDAYRVSIGPMSLPSAVSSLEEYDDDENLERGGDRCRNEWVLYKAQDTEEDVPDGAEVHVTCLHSDFCSTGDSNSWNRVLARALEGRWIMKRAVLLVSAADCSTEEEGCVILKVEDVVWPDGDRKRQSNESGEIAFRLGTSYSFSVVDCSAPNDRRGKNAPTSVPPLDWADGTCPGYQSVLTELEQLLRIEGTASPSGIILTGCAGVGKTRLASCLASLVISNVPSDIHWVSVHDLLLRAGWAAEDDMFGFIVPITSSLSPLIVVLDDLDVLAAEGADSAASLDHERRVVWNSLLQAVDQHNIGPTGRVVRFLGIARDVSQLPPDLFKVGRLEKQVLMIPPSQDQRESILYSILQGAGCDSDLCQLWSELLARMTAGCVAADLRCLCADACTRAIAETREAGEATLSWDHLFEAAKSCVPSQLAALDVTKPHVQIAECAQEDWQRIHDRSWNTFAGNERVKKRIYRTVVVPWRAHLSRDAGGYFKSLVPPSGVLFHGPSGNGKTLAAKCLGSSLGLPMIGVRAAGILDKWLGGSEAAVRSLFARARAAAPSILFFDEIDAIASNRASEGEATGVMSRLLSTLLNEMDGVTSSQKDKVLVVACTNRLDSLDAALLRPGRLEEHIELPHPCEADAGKVLELHLARARVDDGVDLQAVASNLVSSGKRAASAATIEGVAREAVLRAIRRSKDYSEVSVQADDFEEAIRSLQL